jgi:6-pyruvoyltetrahydropterin/6-carboxytetrahydropterin synthase
VSARHRIFVGKDNHKFSCAHMSVFADGSKERLHGHNYLVSVVLDLARIEPILDFAILKRALQEQCDAWNQHLLLPGRSDKFRILHETAAELEFTLCDDRYVVPKKDALVLPTENIVVESLAVVFAEEFVRRLGTSIDSSQVVGIEVTVSESSGQGASYHATHSG